MEQSQNNSSRARPARTALAELIRGSDVTAVFQPIVDVARGEIAAREMLTRPGKGSGFAHAGELFDVAEHECMLWELEELTRRVGIESAAGWKPGECLFLNTSPQVLSRNGFADELHRQLASIPGVTPDRVVVEVTERSEQSYTEGLVREVACLKGHGFDVAIDDVGAGTSGLARIMALKPRWLKLDRELIEAIDSDRGKQNLVRFLLHFARLSGVRVIAEGIEREAELATLIHMGVPFAQGFFLARPGEKSAELPEELSRWCRERWTLERSATHEQSVAGLVRPVTVVEARERIVDAAAQLLRERGVAGLAVVSAGRYVGWCDRQELLRAAGDPRAIRPISLVTAAEAPIVEPHATVAEALRLAGDRDAASAGWPLVVGEAGQPMGLIEVSDLLRAGADALDSARTRTAPVTGLPSRARADEHLRALSLPITGQARDVAFVDLRGFGEFNQVLGFDVGDELLRRVADTLRDVVLTDADGSGEGSEGSDVFLAHLGDDRFLLTAVPGVLKPRLFALAAVFDELERRSPAVGWAPVSASLPAPSLRIVLAVHAVVPGSNPRELYARAAAARETESKPHFGGSTLVTLHPAAGSLRQSA